MVFILFHITSYFIIKNCSGYFEMIRSARPPPCPPLENRKKREFLKNEGGGHKLEVTFFDPLIFYFFIGGAKKCKLGGRENVTYIFWRGGPPYLFVTYIFWPPPKKSCPRGWGSCNHCLWTDLEVTLQFYWTLDCILGSPGRADWTGLISVQ